MKISLHIPITIMEFPQLLKHIEASTITITLLDDQLKIDAPKGSLTKPIIASLKNNKEALINLLKEDSTALSGYNLKNTIQPAEKKAYYPLSSPQKRLYFLNQFDTTSTEYNMPQIIRIEGQLKTNILEEAFQKLIERHESFRTSFHIINNEPVQKIEDTYSFQMTTIKASEEEVPALVEAFIKPFDLKSAPLLNVQVIETGQEQFVLMIDKHHIISDGVSEAQITSEIIQYYYNLELPTLKVQYKDYVEWTLAEAQQAKKKDSEAFWLQQFEDTLEPLELPLDYKRPIHKSFKGDTVDFQLTVEQTSKLKSIAQTEQTTLFMLLLSIYTILLSKLSGQEDIVIGSPIAGRTHADLEGVIGMFVNTLPLRSYPKSGLSFNQYLKTVKETVVNSFEYQNQPLEELIDILKLERDTSRSPLFDVLFAFQNIESETIQINDLKFKPYDNDIKVAKYEQNLSCYEQDNRFYFNFEYVSDLYKRETIERFIGYFKSIINQIIDNASIVIGTIDIVSNEEKNKVLHEFNDTAIPYSKEKTIVDVFETQVKEHSTTKAVIFNNKSITYSELNVLSNNLAQTLIEQGVTKENAVGIYLDRSIEMIIAILGILKSGGAYLPLDITQPKARVETILKDSNCKYIVTDSAGEGKYKTNCLETNIETISRDPKPISFKHKVKPTDLAYYLYTSGSTGTPKGVMVEHHSVVNLIEDRIRTYNITSGERILLFAPIYFDASVEQMLVALLSGSSVVVIEKETLLDINDFNTYLLKHEVTHLNVVPSFLREMEFSKQLHLKRIITGGEAIDLKTARKCITMAPLFNAYGPTESTVTSTCRKYTNADSLGSINIGKPLSNTTCYVLDKNENVCPIGVQGELYLGGVGVSRGYVNNTVLTNERFIKSPFKLGERLYKTGDLVKWDHSGNLDYLGRVDHQVKIRGHRIELGEIEKPLLDHPEIIQSVVLVKGKENEAYLIGYYTAKTTIDEVVLKNYLKDCLPSYMVPNHLIELSEFPLMNNGKLDRKRLPEPDYKSAKKFKAPVTIIEKQLVSIWSKLLNLETDRISINTSFFDAGGHSLKAISLVNKIREVFSVEITLKQVFSKSTIAAIASTIKNANTIVYTAIPKANTQQYYPLSSAQRRMYVLYEFDKNGIGYNMPQAYKILGKVELERLENTFKTLLQRRENLRTVFKLKGEDVVQKIIGAENFKIKQIEVNEDAINDALLNEIQAFNLNKEYPIRVSLIKTNTNQNILFIDIHHIVSDGQSQNILLKEFWYIYNDNVQAPLQLQYKDYAVWQQSKTQQDLVNREKTFWLDTFKTLPKAISLPTDYNRPLVTNHEGSVFNLEFTTETTKQLRALSKQQDVTMFMLLLGVSNILLSKLSNQEDIVLGTITAGRNHRDLEDMMGMFVNTLVLRNDVKATHGFTTFLKDVKHNTLQAFDHQLYQYDELVEALELERDTSRNPLFDIMYSYQRNTTNDLEDEIINSDLKIDANGINLGTNSSKFDLTIAVLENDENLQVAFEYSTALFKLETIQRFATYFNSIIESVLRDCYKLIKDIVILTKEELLQFETFNNTKIDYDEVATISSLFEKQVGLTPNNCAVVFNGKKLSYKELETKTNNLAYKLIEEGVKADEAVGIYLDRSIEMIISIMGILKSGGAYLPLDIDQPEERINKILQDSSCKYIIRDKEDASFYQYKTINIKADYSNEHIANVESKAKPNNLAYYLYTSGSTGTPKGVLVEHRSVVNFINDRIKAYNITKDENILLLAPIYFDASVEQLFIALLAGATTVIIEKEKALDPNVFNDYLIENEVTLLDGVPSFLKAMEFSKDLKLKHILSGGEAIDVETINKCTVIANLHNRYGPTEATVATTSKIYKKGEIATIATIGSPLSNSVCYVLDQNGTLCPIGVQGELYIGGIGVARGYVNNEKLTNDCFIPNPFKAGERLYKTGDLVKWLPQGELEYLGRVDHQIKIRGHRIELGEIEQALLKHPNIMQSVVLLNGKGNDTVLVGYYTTKEDVDEDDIQIYLNGVLPKYMVPSYLIKLPVFPLMNNGKLNRKRLPEPEYKTKVVYQAPINITEIKLVEIWSELLNREQETISVTTSFFELGGHSLKVIRLIHTILKTFNTKVSMVTFFQSPTIREIAACIDNKSLNDSDENDEVILLKKEENDNNIFFIHDGSGEVSGYLELTKYIKTFNCWGIKSPSLNNVFPSNTNLETIAVNYIEKIKAIQPEGPYHVLGWSFGGNMAYEIVKQLEQQGNSIASFTVIDSKIPFVDDIENSSLTDFSVEKEKELIKTLLKIEPVFFKEEHTIASLWKAVTHYLVDNSEVEILKSSIPDAMKLLIPNFDFIETEALIKAINTIRTLDGAVSKYKQSTQPNTPITYFKASESEINIEKIQAYFNTQSEYIEVEGNHFSILKNDIILQQIASRVNLIPKNKVLEKI